MKLTMRLYQTEDDTWRIQGFLREVFLLNGRREVSWQAARFDHWRRHGIETMKDGQLERESAGEATLQVHPGRRTPELEQEMIAAADEIPGA